MSPAIIALSLVFQTTNISDQLATRYLKWDVAYRKHDVKSLATLLHPRLRIITVSGKAIKRADYVRSLWKSKAPEKYHTSLLSVERMGQRAIALTIELSQKRGEKEQLHRYRDTWQLESGHWLLLESRTLGEK